MRHRSRTILTLLVTAACGPAPFTNMPAPAAGPGQLAANAAVDSTGKQIRIRLSAPPQEAATMVVQALVERDVPVTSNNGGVIEARLPREMGFLGSYDLVVRAYVSPDSTGSRVLLFAEEVTYTKYAPQGLPNRISARNQGRALKTWQAMVAVGKELGTPR